MGANVCVCVCVGGGVLEVSVHLCFQKLVSVRYG